jgi:hypothetical protein
MAELGHHGQGCLRDSRAHRALLTAVSAPGEWPRSVASAVTGAELG